MRGEGAGSIESPFSVGGKVSGERSNDVVSLRS